MSLGHAYLSVGFLLLMTAAALGQVPVALIALLVCQRFLLGLAPARVLHCLFTLVGLINFRGCLVVLDLQFGL